MRIVKSEVSNDGKRAEYTFLFMPGACSPDLGVAMHNCENVVNSWMHEYKVKAEVYGEYVSRSEENDVTKVIIVAEAEEGGLENV